MSENQVSYEPIGIVRTPFESNQLFLLEVLA